MTTQTHSDAQHGFSTRAVHGRVEQRCTHPYHALQTPIVQTATYTFADSADLSAFQDAKMWGGTTNGRSEYARFGNPTVQEVERRIAALENGEAALLYPTGMSAITNLLLTVLPTGAHIILTDDCYRRTRTFCETFLKRLGIETSVVPLGDYDALAGAIRPNTRIILSESPTNPYLRVVDLARLAAIAKGHPRIKTIIDATFATPINVRPLEFGVDFVVHSASKYLSGHNDLLAGVVVGAAGLLHGLRQSQGILGGVLDPHTAFLLGRGLKTLALRVTRQNATAQRVAEFLEAHSAVERVWYPGLAAHPDHAVAATQMSGFGGVVSFEIAPLPGLSPLESASRFIDALTIPLLAASLGGPETLVEQPALMSYHELSTEERLSIGIKDNLVRLALGLEDAEDLIADLAQALHQKMVVSEQ
ncbi:MAG: aminotransferase class I/II-fold pyridoxal phosphate-dependent enzyme [Anaerolineae bacterium]|nr:aminotransferase class I/II-fold pyridoxal phosphate-dependent enzyme [Anaerolineae bacterium]